MAVERGQPTVAGELRRAREPVARRGGEPVDGGLDLAQQGVDAAHVVLRVVIVAEGTQAAADQVGLPPRLHGVTFERRAQAADGMSVAGGLAGGREAAEVELAERPLIRVPGVGNGAGCRGAELGGLLIAPLGVATEAQVSLGR